MAGDHAAEGGAEGALARGPSSPRAHEGPTAWALELEPASAGPGAPLPAAGLRVAGLSTALRLALTAQSAGAQAIVVPAASPLREALHDSRLVVPVLERVEARVRLLVAPASLVAHKATVAAVAAWPGHSSRELSGTEPPAHAAYAFATLDVVDEAQAREAERRLFRSLRKAQDGWTSRYLNRYVSLAISRLLVKTRLRPNQVSVAILGVGALGGILAARGGYADLLAGAICFQLQSILDGCDGEMSRVSFRGSRLGEWLDTIGDDLTNYGFFSGAALGLYRTTAEPLYLLAGAVTVGAGALSSGLEYRYLLKIGSGDLLRYPLSESASSGRFAWLSPIFKRDTFVLLTLFAALFSALGPMLCIFALAALGILISVIKTELRLAREARAQSPS